MNLKQILRGTKLTLDTGKWHSGHIPRTAFPMSAVKNKSYKFGPEYQWRVVRFECVATVCRVLIVLNENKQIFRATLGVEDGADMRVLCQYEYHASEPGWHCHLNTEQHEQLPVGVMRSHLRRWPQKHSQPSKMLFNVTQNSALTLAAERFRFRAQGEML